MWTFLLIVVLVVTLFVLLRLQHKSTVAPVFSFSLLLCFGLWYLVPTILTVLFWGTNTSYGFQLKSIGLDYNAYASVALIETSVFLATILLLLALKRPSFRFITESRLARQTLKPSLILGVLTISFAVVVYFGFSSHAYWGSDYLERNSFSMTADAEMLGVSSVVATMTELIGCFAFACLLTPLPRTTATRVLVWLSWGFVLHTVAVSVFSGQRIMLLSPIVVYMMRNRALALWSWRRTMQVLGVAFVTMLIGAPAALLLGDIRGGGEINADYVQTEVADRPSAGLGDQVLDSVQELVVKFNSPLCGELLLETGTGFGWHPFVGAALALVPRMLLPDKPVPGSMTNDYWGHPTRVVAQLLGMEKSGNVQVSPGAIAIWELGYPGLLLLIIANLLLFYLLNSLLLVDSIVCKVLALYIVQIPVFYTLFSSPDNVLQMGQRTAVLLIVAVIVQRVIGGGSSEPEAVRPLSDPLNAQ